MATVDGTPRPAAGGFGPSALATPANALTAARLLLTPFLLALLLHRPSSWPAIAAWVVLAGSDMVDGWMARRQGSTRSGAFLDPLADKVLVLGALVVLVVKSRLWWLPVALIGAREVVISVYRSSAGRRGVSIPARKWAKVKTTVQEVAVGLVVFPPTAHHRWVANSVLWLAVALTLVTGAQYLLDGRKASRAV
jgi:CDP-diacylglycerol--glycerol-3-phosphate 3-phosphatidyltransferase